MSKVYTVTRSGLKHKKRKHPVEDETTRLKRVAKQMKQRDIRKKKKIADRAKGKKSKLAKALLDSAGRFKKGNPGKPKGAVGIPGERAVKASVRAILEKVVKERAGTIESAIVRGISSGPSTSHLYLRLAVEHIDGKPVDTVNINSQYKKDELEHAKENLGRKLDRLMKVIVENKRRPAPRDPEPVAVPPGASTASPPEGEEAAPVDEVDVAMTRRRRAEEEALNRTW
jgi:hypothetical protein